MRRHAMPHATTAERVDLDSASPLGVQSRNPQPSPAAGRRWLRGNRVRAAAAPRRVSRGANSAIPRLRAVTLSIALGLALAAQIGAQPLGTGPTHKGIVPAGPFQIFPENRPGNGVYLDRTLLLALPGQTILSVAQIGPGGRFIYVARGADSKRVVGVKVLPGDAEPRVSEPAKGYQYVVSGFEGQGYKKFFRLTETTVTDLLPTSRTADGLTSGAQGIVFFHVGSTAGSTPGEAVPAGQYGIRLHWLSLPMGAVKHLGRPIYNGLPTLKLEWLDDGRIQYTLTDGKRETLSTSDFK